MSVRNKLIRFFAATILVGRAAAFFFIENSFGTIYFSLNIFIRRYLNCSQQPVAHKPMHDSK